MGAAVPNSTASIKYNGSSQEPGLSVDEQVARKRAELGPRLNPDGTIAPPTPPDIADIASRDLMSGQVRKARGGSTASAILGSFNPTAPLCAPSILGSF